MTEDEAVHIPEQWMHTKVEDTRIRGRYIVPLPRLGHVSANDGNERQSYSPTGAHQTSYGKNHPMRHTFAVSKAYK